MRAMILAAGLGSRLEPITRDLPKPLVPVLGVPNIVRIIKRLKASGTTEIVVNTHWQGEVLEAALGDGGEWGVDIAYSRESRLLGTGGGIKKALPLLGPEPFLVINGDALFAPDFEEAAAFHEASDALATLVVRRDPEADKYGAVGLDDSGRVRYLVWAGDASAITERFMFTGMHVLHPDIGERLPDEGCIVRETYIPMLETGIRLVGLARDGYFCDLGTPARYLEANIDLALGRVTMPDIAVPEKGIYIGRHTIIGENSRILAGSVVGDRCRIASNVTVERAVIFDDAEVTESVSDAIVTSNGQVVTVL